MRTLVHISHVQNLSKTLPKLSITCRKTGLACSKHFPSIASSKIIYRRSFEQFEQSVETVQNSLKLSTGGVENFKPTYSSLNNCLGISLCYSDRFGRSLVIYNPDEEFGLKVLNSFDSTTKTTIFNKRYKGERLF